MHKEKALIGLLRGLAELVAREADRNADFAASLDALLSDLPGPKARAVMPKPADAGPPENLPDIHAEWAARGEAAFRRWLAGQPIPVLRAVISREDLDPTRKSSRWRTSQKLADFLADGLAARRARGGGFLSGSAEA